MHFQADDDFPPAGAALDELGACHGILHHVSGRAVKFADLSMARPARSTVASSNARPMICNPRGNPSWDSPAGTEMPGKPARFTVTVNTSFKYIETGSA